MERDYFKALLLGCFLSLILGYWVSPCHATLRIDVEPAQAKEGPQSKYAIKFYNDRNELVAKTAVEKPPIYVLSEGTREYYVAISSNAKPIDIIAYHYRGFKGIIFFGEELGHYDFSISSITCIRSDPKAKGICQKAESDWTQLEVDSEEIKKCHKENDRALELFKRTTDYHPGEITPKIMELYEGCATVEDKFTRKYTHKVNYSHDLQKLGFIYIQLGPEYNLVQ